MISFTQYLILTEDLPKRAHDIIKNNPDRMKAILKWIRFQRKTGLQKGAGKDKEGLAYTREFGSVHQKEHGNK
jgi:hypothetical protein